MWKDSVSKMNQKELNKILPSYLIDEVESNKNDSEEKQASASDETNSVTFLI
jgi:hypothetical protein